MRELLLLFVSILPVYLIGRYIYNKDRDKEPVGLLAKLFLSGIGSFILTLILTLLIGVFIPSLIYDDFNLDMFSLFIHVFFGIALIEEFSKWIFVYKLSYNNVEYDQVYDMIVYSVFVAIGFACIENVFYVFENGLGVGIIRGLLSVPGHACDGVFMGYYLSMSKYVSSDTDLKKHYLFMSLFIPVFLHSFYDFCLFSEKYVFIVVFIFFIIFLYRISYKRVKIMSNVTTKFK